jgi:hypothetical protein
VSATKSSPSDPINPSSSDFIKPSIKLSDWKTVLSRISQLETDHCGSMNCVFTTFRSQSQVVQAVLKLLDEQNDELKAQVAHLTETQMDIPARFQGVACGDVEQAHSVVRAEVQSELLTLEHARPTFLTSTI